jgi:hypothetical protein
VRYLLLTSPVLSCRLHCPLYNLKRALLLDVNVSMQRVVVDCAHDTWLFASYLYSASLTFSCLFCISFWLFFCVYWVSYDFKDIHDYCKTVLHKYPIKVTNLSYNYTLVRLFYNELCNIKK